MAETEKKAVTYDEKVVQAVRNKVNGHINVSEVLAGKKPMEGKLGAKIQAQRNAARNTPLSRKQSEKITNSFRDFDNWTDRIEKAVNGLPDDDTDLNFDIDILAGKITPKVKPQDRRIKVRRRAIPQQQQRKK